MSGVSGHRVAFLVAPEGVEQVELTEPWQAVQNAGATPELLSVRRGQVQAFHHLDKADTFAVQKVVTDVSADDYAGLVLPGGVANPDALRQAREAVRFVVDFFERDKPVAAICHAAWLLVEANVVRGRSLTSYPSLTTDLRNAGANWTDAEVVVDRNLITSRGPKDLPAFCAQVVERMVHSMQPSGA